MSQIESTAGRCAADAAIAHAAEAHRLANVLQLLASLLAYRRRCVDDPVARAEVEWAEQVAQALMLHAQPGPVDAGVGFVELLAQQVARWRPIYRARLIDLALEADAVHVPEHRRVTLTLAVNELLTNALKHGFPNGEGAVLVVLRRVDRTTIELSVSDNGVGLPNEVRTDRTGLPLLERLTRQLGGTLDIDGSAGTKVRLRFPAEAADSHGVGSSALQAGG